MLFPEFQGNRAGQFQDPAGQFGAQGAGAAARGDDRPAQQVGLAAAGAGKGFHLGIPEIGQGFGGLLADVLVP